MNVQELMSRDVQCVAPDETMQNAAERMRSLDVGPLPVCENNRLVGMLTDRDIVVRGVADGADPKSKPVREVMSPQVSYCYEDQPAEEAAQMMKKQKIRRLIVLNRDKQMVGMLSLADMAKNREAQGIAEDTLECVSQPT